MYQLLYTLGSFAYTFGTFILVISCIVFIHEFGHYCCARFFGVKVESFALGFGKELFGFEDRSGTRWKVCIIPAGGYVKMFCDSADSIESLQSQSNLDKESSFFFRPLYQKSIIALGGPLANFLSAILMIFIIYISLGKSFVEPIVTALSDDSPAVVAGLKVGDHIKKVADYEVEDFADVVRLVSLNVGESLDITVLRNNKLMSFNINPDFTWVKDLSGNKIKVARLGIASDKIKNRSLAFSEAVLSSLTDSMNIVGTTAKVLMQLVSGKRNIKELGGPIRIAQYSGHSLAQGWIQLLWLMITLSVNLAFINLLPIPVLDGGHIAHNVIEKFIGQTAALKFQAYANKVGMSLLVILFAVITFNDISALFS